MASGVPGAFDVESNLKVYARGGNLARGRSMHTMLLDTSHHQFAL
jgi:hypothetical protein